MALAAGTSATTKRSPQQVPQELSSRKEDLEDLRQRIDRLKKEVAAGESARSEAADQLRGHETAISDLQRQLFDLALAREAHLQRQQELGAQTALAERKLAQQQGRLDHLLVQQYMTGTPGPLHLLLSGQNPNQTTRDMTYLGLIGQARQGVVKETTTLIEEKKQLADETRQQAEAVAAIETQQKKRQEDMQLQRQLRVQMLAGISSRISVQRREIETLRRDEQRLARLLERLGKMLAQKAKPVRPPVRTEPPARKGELRPSPVERPTTLAGTSFAALKGKLALPANGPITQRFGATLDGGGRSKGLFIRAAAGGEVRAIAAGQVVYADWLRGFGNLIVVDHADGFLSVYGQNDALLKQVGDEVRSGDRIAAVGNSGGRPETGLYFELRRQGEAIDPGQWLRK